MSLFKPSSAENDPDKEVKAARYTAEYSDDFVAFFIGMRINKVWQAHE